MGSTTSKPETKVFTPTTPVDFSASFLAQLDNSIESDYSRSQYTEKYIQDRVSQELAKLEKTSADNFNASVKDSLLPAKEDDTTTVKSTNEKLDKLIISLQNANKNSIVLSDDLKGSRSKVIQCLNDNIGRPLNCWDEVENFKKLVSEL